MPDPGRYKSKKKFISDCMRQVHQEGKKTQEQAAGQCYGMWRGRKRKGKKKKECCSNLIRILSNKIKESE